MTEQQLTEEISALYKKANELQRIKSELARERFKEETNAEIFALAEKGVDTALMLYTSTGKGPFLFIGKISLDEDEIWLDGITFEKNPEISSNWMYVNTYFSEELSSFKSAIIQKPGSFSVSSVEETMIKINEAILKFNKQNK